MGKKKKNTNEDAKKYRRARELANARNRKYKANLSQDKLEAKRKRDRERYYRLREEKKIKLVSEMTEKEKKECRKVWRKRKAALRKKKKDEKEMLQNTPPNSDIDDYLESNQGLSRQKIAGRKAVRKDRAKVYYDLKKQKEENKKLRAKMEKYKKRLQRERQKNSNVISPSPSKKVRKLVGKERVSPNIKRKLFSSYVLEKQLKSAVTSNSPKTKESQIISKVIGSKILRKYRVQKEFTSVVSYWRNKNLTSDEIKFDRKKYSTLKVKEALAIRKFYLNDQVSKMLPGKKDYVKRGKLKMQRRVLLDTLANLYGKFREQIKIDISYTTFARCRPFWVQKPKERDRETCACSKHENMELVVKALYDAKSILYRTAHEALTSLVCSTKNEKCMYGKCRKCFNKVVHFDEDAQEFLKLSQWESKTETKIIKGKEKTIKKVVKVTKEYQIDVVVDMFKMQMTAFKKHVFAMKHQWDSLNTLVENLKDNEIVLQVDFSQNYVSKCTTEIQSMHFGASKPQISLHTGIMHFKKDNKVKCKSFCTVSDNIDHKTHAVWAHLEPILKKAAMEFPNTNVVHIFSDSPSSQYRNKTNVHLMTDQLPKIFQNLSHYSWNFMESGHGKGAMDGVGGSIKRNADQLVLHGKDILCAKDLTEAFGSSATDVIEVPGSAIEDFKTRVPQKLNVIEGIMQMRQIYWNGTSLFGRKMSCFECDKKCKHHHLKIIGLPVKKNVLKVSEVYSGSSEEEDVTQSLDEVTFDTKYDFNDLKPETFVVVSFEFGKKKSKNFVAVIQRELSEDREAEVLFLKPNSDNQLFQPDEHDVAWVSCDQILGTLPSPEMIFQGERLFYKFDKRVIF